MSGYYDTFCPECGRGVACDEEGLCIGCGATAVGSAADKVLAEFDSIRDRLAEAQERMKELEEQLEISVNQAIGMIPRA